MRRDIKLGIAGVVIAITLFLPLVLASFSEKLGHGYRLVPRSVDSGNCANCFEGVAHYSDFYYRKTRIADRVGRVDISPSGRFAAYEANGKLMLFDRKQMRSRNVTDGAFAIPKEFAWQEADNLVVVSYYEDHKPSTIRLIATK